MTDVALQVRSKSAHKPFKNMLGAWEELAMKIALDGQDWQTEDEFLESVLVGVGAPSWHGRNYNAIRDSFVTASVNSIAPPYDFSIKMPPEPTSEVAEAVRYFMSRISDWSADGAKLSARLA